MTELEKKAYILIRRKTTSSRAELARGLGVSRPTASSVVESLLDNKLICECGKGKSTGGKTPVLLSAAENMQEIIGIDLGYTDRMSGVVIDGAGNVTAKAEMSFEPENLDSITETSAFLVKKLESGRHIGNVAVALSAIVNESDRRIIASINPVFRQNDFEKTFESRLGKRVFFSNRSRAAAISEAFGGAADGEKDFALISLGRSVGAAFWCNGELFSGATSSAGEIRNLRLSNGMILEEALSRDRVARDGVGNIVSGMAEVMEQVTGMIDVGLLVLSGRFVDFGSDFAEMLENKLGTLRSIRIRQACFGRFSAARGCAFQMGEKLLQ